MKNLIIIVVALVALMAAVSGCHQTHRDGPVPRKACAMGDLKGKKFSGLYSMYLKGSDDTCRVGSIDTIDFQKNLQLMWKSKSRKSASRVVREAGDSFIAEYGQHANLITFKDYAGHISDVVKVLKDSIDWHKVGKIMRLSNDRSDLVREIACSVNGRDMSAYILTELMPSKQGRLNVELLDFLLREAGSEFMESIPAMYDKKTSLGPYQFTEYAVFATPKELRGASVVNQAVAPSQRIPGSVIKLRGDDHHRAAFLFVIYNVAQMVRELNPRELSQLKDSWDSRKDDVFLYCATAHHSPGAARLAARKWLDGGAKRPFEESCGRRISDYAEKTRCNLAAL